MAEKVTPLRNSMTVELAAALGRRELLVALRDKVAAGIDGDIHVRDLSALSRRLVDIAEQIEALDEAADDIAAAAAIPDEAWSVKRS